MAANLGIGRMATKYEYEGTIRRVTVKPRTPVKYPYLVVSEKIENAQHVDIVVVKDFDRVREKLKKKVRSGLGLEIKIGPAKVMNSEVLAKWLVNVQDLYQFCMKARCQLVISSGATSPWSMVSGRSFDALLEEVCITPATYWKELEEWLELRLAARVTL